MSNLMIKDLPITSLKPHPRNPRVHSKKQIEQISRSIQAFGFIGTVLVDANNRIIAGHGRVEAAKLLKMETVPTLCVSHLSEAQVLAYVIADNKLALNAGWDGKILAANLKELKCDLPFEITITGFEVPELDMLAVNCNSELEAPDEVPAVVTGPAVTKPGDLWRIGNHLVLCGDATDKGSYETLMGGEQARMVFSDPPYNVAITGHVCGRGKVQHDEFAMASGEMSKVEFTTFLARVFQNLADASLDGSLHYLCMDWRHMGELMAAASGPYSELKNVCVWNKTNAGMGALYRSQHELVFLFKKGKGEHINNVQLGTHGRNRSNVWTYPGINAFGAERDAELAMHPTVKPVAMVADAILDVTNPGDIVLDAFGGSGTTLVAAEQTGRRGRAIEIAPQYVDTIVRRLSKAMGAKATLVGTNETFEVVEAWQKAGMDQD